MKWTISSERKYKSFSNISYRSSNANFQPSRYNKSHISRDKLYYCALSKAGCAFHPIHRPAVYLWRRAVVWLSANLSIWVCLTRTRPPWPATDPGRTHPVGRVSPTSPARGVSTHTPHTHVLWPLSQCHHLLPTGPGVPALTRVDETKHWTARLCNGWWNYLWYLQWEVGNFG